MRRPAGTLMLVSGAMLLQLSSAIAIANDVCPNVSPSTIQTPADVKDFVGTMRLLGTFLAAGFRCCADPIPVQDPARPTPKQWACPPSVPPSRVEAESKCDNDFSESVGTTCIGKIPGYPEPVAIVVPPKLKEMAQANVLLSMHGDNPDYEPVDSHIKRRGMPAMLTRTGRNQILVFPAGGSCPNGSHSAYDKNLGNGPGFEKFMSGIGALFQKAGISSKPEVGNITIAAHSGSYKALSGIVSSKNAYSDRVNEVFCFDCMYEDDGVFAKYAKDPRHRFWSVFTGGGKTAHNNRQMRNQLDVGKEPYYFGCDVYAGCDEDKPGFTRNPGVSHASPSDYKANRIGFLYTDEGHGNVPTAYLEGMLKGSP